MKKQRLTAKEAQQFAIKATKTISNKHSLDNLLALIEFRANQGYLSMALPDKVSSRVKGELRRLGYRLSMFSTFVYWESTH